MSSESGRRVVITGAGVVSPGGIGRRAFWETLAAGRSCVATLTRFDSSALLVHMAGQVPDFDPSMYAPAGLVGGLGRVSSYGVVAAWEALEDSGLDRASLDPERVGVSFGTSMGGTEAGIHRTFRELHNGGGGIGSDVVDEAFEGEEGELVPFFSGDLTATVCGRFDFLGPTALVSTGCTAASDAIGFAFECIRDGRADVMLAGGAEAPIGPLTIQAFDAIGALSHRCDRPGAASRPFDRDRDGFVLAEGAGVLVLEPLERARRRGASIYGEIAAYATTCDAYHLTASDPSIQQAARAVRLALAQAGAPLDRIDYVSAHASSTPMNDMRETQVVKAVFGDHAYRLAISGIKSMIGHASGAAGAMQGVTAALVLRHQVIPPTINYETPDPQCDLDCVPNVARDARVGTILQNTYAFAGKNVAIVYRGMET